MSTLVFDIETVGEDWLAIDEVTQDSLTRWIDRTARSEEEKSIMSEAVKERLGFSPLTGSIVSLAVYDIERNIGAVYYSGDGTETDFSDETFSYKRRSETEILEDFWESAHLYDVFVTFNGRQFDVPFLLLRSIACSVKPTVDFNHKRYLSQQSTPYHVDLLEELTFHGALNKRPQLHLFCRAFGIKSPKTEISGDQIAELFKTKKFADIARHNAKDVIATTELYQHWLNYLAPPSFINATML